MIRYFRALTVFLLSVAASSAMAQNTATTSSPYSKYGIGLLSPTLLPQNVAMGGIGVATNAINGFNNINTLNPAAYTSLKYTVIDAGMYGNFVKLSKTGVADQNNSNFRFSHLAVGVPISKNSGASFGLMPYSELGYKYTQTLKRGYGTTSPADTNIINNVYSGEGGLSKAYIGYGTKIYKGLTAGVNVAYIFGNLKQFSSTEYPDPFFFGAFNSRQESNSSVGGLSFDYGLQYAIDLDYNKHLTFGYSGSASTKLNSESSFVVSQYTTDLSGDAENIAADTVVNIQNPASKLQLPTIHRFGVSYQFDGKYLIGADYSIGNWSKFTVNGASQGLSNTSSLNIGGQFNPDTRALNSYWSLVDYRLGAHFEKTYVVVNNQNINQYGVTFGLGLPLARNGTAFYKINFGADLGQRGTLNNSLVKETYLNVHLSFTLNDKWFNKYKFD